MRHGIEWPKNNTQSCSLKVTATSRLTHIALGSVCVVRMMEFIWVQQLILLVKDCVYIYRYNSAFLILTVGHLAQWGLMHKYL